MPHPEPERRTNAPPGPERLLAGLTPEQAQAVTHGTGPLLLIAGPGAGKGNRWPRPTPEALCEERRLFYVAATRAKDRLILTQVRTRAGRDTAGPSRFLYEAGLLSRSTRQAA